MDTLENFVDEILFEDLKFFQIVGRGAFGVVSRAEWKGIDVAVKHIETESEKRAFITELKQLSRVSHPNIVHLYGACTKQPVCLVMEYAEGGSLYNVLHVGGNFRAEYTLAHALSWCLQCALGVEYLHGMKPKALIHRDLKPPNLLLVQGGTLLKICDFGTACDYNTYMTNNKGSAAWMAPEVFEGSTYSEKCDVFSFGIILWEVLSRRKPFEEIGGPAFRIMWAVHQGTRPPLIRDCPKPIENVMTKCWAKNAPERPSMGEVVRVMSAISQYLPGADEPILYPSEPEARTPVIALDTPPPTFKPDTVRHGDPVPLATVRQQVKPVVVEEFQRMTSAPASLAASRENLQDKSPSRSSTPSADYINKRYSADLSGVDFAACGPPKGPPVRGHRRTGSHGTAIPQSALPQHPAGKGHRRTGSYGNSPLTSGDMAGVSSLHHVTTAPANLGNASMHAGAGSSQNLPPPDMGQRSFSWAPETTGMESLEVHIQPLAPSSSSQESIDIYRHHLELAKHYLQVQAEIQALTQRKSELTAELDRDVQEHENNTRFISEYAQLQMENEDLQSFYDNLKRQAEVLIPDLARSTSSSA